MKSIKLRPASLMDALFLLRLKNDPVTRKFAIVTHKKIQLIDHLFYLSDHIQDIQIILVDGERAGDIRIDEEISIRLDEKYRGLGVGYKALKKVIKKDMIAKIVNGNIPSMRLFISLGFKPIDYKEGYYIFKL